MRRIWILLLLLAISCQLSAISGQQTVDTCLLIKEDKLSIAKQYYDSAYRYLANHDYMSSLPKLIKVAELIESLPEDMSDEEIHLTSRAYYQMGEVFSRMFINSYAAETALRASQYQDMRQDSVWMLYTKIRLAQSYQTMSEYDSVEFYIKQIMPLSDSVKHPDDYWVALNLVAKHHYDKKEYDTAFVLFQNIIDFKYRRNMTTLSDSVSKGILMFHSPYKYQSKPYLLKMFDMIATDPQVNMRDMGLMAFLLSKLYEEEGNKDSVAICNKFMPEFIDDMANDKSDEMKAKILYEQFKEERDSRLNELKLRKERIRNRNIAIYSVIVIIVLLIIANISIRRRNRKQHSSKYEEKWKSIEQSELMRRIKSKLLTDDGEKITVKNIEIYNDRNLSSIDIIELRHLFDTTFDGLISKLAEQYPDLSPTDICCCCLSMANLTNSELAVLLGVKYSALHTRIVKIKKIFETEKSLRDFMVRYYSTIE